MVRVNKEEKEAYFRSVYPVLDIEKILGKNTIKHGKINHDFRFVSLHLICSVASEYDISEWFNQIDWKIRDSNPYEFLLQTISRCKRKLTIGYCLASLVNASLTTKTVDIEKYTNSSAKCLYNGLSNDEVLCVNVMMPILTVNRHIFPMCCDDVSIVGIDDCFYRSVFKVCTTFKDYINVNATIKVYKSLPSKSKRYVDLDNGSIIQESSARNKESMNSKYKLASNDKQRIKVCLRAIKSIKNSEDNSGSSSSEDDSKSNRKKIKKINLDKIKKKIVFDSDSESQSEKESESEIKTKSKAKIKAIPKQVKKNLFEKTFVVETGNCSKCLEEVEHHNWMCLYMKNPNKFKGNMEDNISIVCKDCYKKSDKTFKAQDLVPKALKDRIWFSHTRQGGVSCYTCQEYVKWNEWHASHIIARSEGGENTLENLKVCCSHCNQSMSSMNMNDYIEKFHAKHPCL